MRFKAGKTYRTNRGLTAQVLNDHGDCVQPYRICVKGDAAWAHADGSFRFFSESHRMLPGAIEDEKPETVDIPSAESIRMNNLQAQIDTLRKRVEELMHKVGKLEVAAVCDPIIKARNGYAEACTAAVDRAKATIKGGWVNVYRREGEPDRVWTTANPYPTREKADQESMGSRIACIQIPDFTEGEGL